MLELGIGREAWIAHGGAKVLLEAAAWKPSWDGKTAFLVFLSVVGPREAVRAVLAGWATGKSLSLHLEGKALQGERGGYGKTRYATHRLGRLYHGVGWVEGYFYARERDDRKAALWLSRQAEAPVHPAWVPLVLERAEREGSALRTYRMFALPPLSRYDYEDLVREALELDREEALAAV